MITQIFKRTYPIAAIILVALLIDFLHNKFAISFSSIISDYIGIFSLIFLSLIVYFLYLALRSKADDRHAKLYDHWATFLQTIFAIVAIWYAVQENKDSSIQFTQQLQNQKEQIKQQDSLIKIQQEVANLTLNELKSIAGSSGGIKKNMESISSLVGEMPKKIDGITASFGSLTEYSKQEAELLRQKSQNNANLSIASMQFEKESNTNQYNIKNIYIKNIGNLPCRLMKVEISFDTTLFYDVYSSYISSDSPYYIEKNGDKFLVTFDYSFRTFTVSGFDKKFKLDYVDRISLRLREQFEGITEFSIVYSIYFYDDNDGRFSEGTFNVKLQ